MEQPLISVIIPCYNLEALLPRTLESIECQEKGYTEYLFINDGSTDATKSILAEFCKKNPAYKLIDKANGGVSSARNTGLKEAKGDYIYIFDGDDELTHDAVSLMKKSIEIDNPDIIISATYVKRNNKVFKKPQTLQKGVFTSNEVFALNKDFPVVAQLLYKKSLIDTNNINFNTNLSLGEVWEFTIRALGNAEKVSVVDDYYFYYHQNEDSAMHSFNYERDLSILRTLQHWMVSGQRYASSPAFAYSCFKCIISSTYTKYIKYYELDSSISSVISKIYDSDDFKRVLKVASKNKSLTFKERAFLSYVSFSKVWGFKLLHSLLHTRMAKLKRLNG